MGTKRKVSVIIPFYNVEGCIERCLQSVARQTMTDMEVLLIDDCGQDRSADIVHDFIASYEGDIDFKVIRQDHNQGQSAARNRGIREAVGEYVYFLDSDDYISDDCIELLADEFNKHPDVQMVIGNYKIVGPLYLAPFALQQRVHTSDEIIREQLRFDIYTMPWNKLIKRDFLIDNNLFFQPGIVHEDNLWSFCSAFCYDKMAVVLTPTYYYIIRQGSTERSHTREWHQQQLFEVFKCLVRFVFESNAPSKKNVKQMTEVFRYIEREMMTLIMDAYKRGDKAVAYNRYQEVRSLPYWSLQEVEALPDITEKDIKRFRHLTCSIEKGFNRFVRQYRKYQLPNEINTMKISVITVCFNNLPGLRRTIPSVLSQTYTGYEYIVIDGGSTDGSKEYLQAQERIDYWVSEPDEGVYNAMNKAVQKAHGEYCVFMNAGDTFFSAQSLENVVDKLRGADCYTGCAAFVDGQKTYTCCPPARMSFDFLLVNALNHQASFIKTAFLKDNPYDERYKITADWGLFMRKWIKGECSYESLPDIISIYYMDGISSTSPDVAVSERMMQMEQLLQEMSPGFKKNKMNELVSWYRRTTNYVHSPEIDDGSSAARHKQKLIRKINQAMSLSPMKRDWKITMNALKMFFKDMFV